MRVFRVALFAFLAACSASAAWAQYGLYGSPDVLPVPQQNVAENNQAYQPYQYPGGYHVSGSRTRRIQPYQPGRNTVSDPYTARRCGRPSAGQPARCLPPAMPRQHGPMPQGQGAMNRVGNRVATAAAAVRIAAP